MSTLKIGLSGLSPLELVNKAQILVEKMTLNNHFPHPEPSVAVLAARKDILADCISKAFFNDPKSAEKQQEAYNTLVELIHQLAGYVTRIADGNSEILLSSGFDIRSKRKKSPMPEHPENFQVHISDEGGTTRLEWEKVSGNYAYVIQITSTNPETGNAVWVTAGVTTRTELIIQNLKLGMRYYFRIKTAGRLFESPYSSVATICAA